MPNTLTDISKDFLNKRYVQEGASVKDLALEKHCSSSAISRALRRHGIQARSFSTKGLKPRLGAVLSEETKEKIRQGHLGKKLSPDHRDQVIKTLNHGKGDKNPAWKGGETRTGTGYVLVRQPKHPCALGNGYVPKHRLVVEASLNRPLASTEHVHHINGIKDDNRLENLAVVTPEEHWMIHRGSVEARAKVGLKTRELRKTRFWSTKSKSKH